MIFGGSGVGKSSLVNMLAGGRIAETSDDVLGCTFQSRQYTITINGERINLWDTAGLDEGTRGRVSPRRAEKNLITLLRELQSADGVHLLVYCIRGPGVRKSLARNYIIFYSSVCRKKVPIVAVVTGLEHESTSMDDWWTTGEKKLAKYKMRFDGHACVTTIDMKELEGSVLQRRSTMSRQVVQELVINNCHRLATPPSFDINFFIKATLLDFRSMIRSGWENVQPNCSVVFCQTDVTFLQSHLDKTFDHKINGRFFFFQHAGRSPVGRLRGSGDSWERHITPRVSKGAADLLIFAGSMSGPNVETFRKFYASYNGEICPLLVVTRDDSLDGWTKQLNDLGIPARLASISSSSTTVGQTEADLCDLIDELCLVRWSVRHYRTGLSLRCGTVKDFDD